MQLKIWRMPTLIRCLELVLKWTKIMSELDAIT
jgi:hypothetical protein